MDHFPQTMRTWIGARLASGAAGRQLVNAHVMETYALPLRIYLLGSSARDLGEPDEIVNGFFADRLDRPGFFDAWQTSGKRLRYWLINAFGFYLKEERRRRFGRARREGAPEEEITFDGDPARAIDRAVAVAFVERAMATAAADCRAAGMEAHWEMLLQHGLRGSSLAEVGAAHGTTAERARIMIRSARRRFEAALRELLEGDGAEPEQVDAELVRLMEAIG